MAKTKEELFDEVNLLAQEVGVPLFTEKDKKELSVESLKFIKKTYQDKKNTRKIDGERHCDDYIHDLSQPNCLRFFLLVNRMPAVDALLLRENGVIPQLYATYKDDTRVRVTMASRIGDVGITVFLKQEDGYSLRVAVAELTDFSNTPFPLEERLSCGCRAGRRHSKSNCKQGLPSDPA